jgi:hypothetical protein
MDSAFLNSPRVLALAGVALLGVSALTLGGAGIAPAQDAFSEKISIIGGRAAAKAGPDAPAAAGLRVLTRAH